jgi:Pyruvate/2-oxoacid:ferredoxin oxidoreductase delta subunit
MLLFTGRAELRPEAHMNRSRQVGKVIGVVVLVVILSFFVGKLFGEKADKQDKNKPIVVSETMTVEQFGRENQIDKKILKKVFGLQSEEDLKKTIGSFSITKEQITDALKKEKALDAEFESKNWILIPIKFVLWIVFLIIVFTSLRKSAVTTVVRSILYLIAVTVFGVILGSDPSPMGTVKDAVVLLGTKHVVFPPRLMAMSLFLVFVLLANKFICSWGCQFGTLQDLLFRLFNVHKKGGKRLLSVKFRLPFVFTNTVRVTVFCLLWLFAFAWGIDLIHPIDPFKIYRPAVVGLGGGIFIAALLAASLLIYRPWCHLFCPFGLVGWLVEKISIFKIKVNYDTCIACQTCAKSCPSTVMDAILKRTRVIPDCFSCGTCIEVCPTKSITFASGKRTMPPEGKFSADKEHKQ